MGRKRKAETTFNEDKTSNDYSETTIANLEKHSHSTSANTTEAMDTGNIVHSNSNGLSPKNSNPQVTTTVVRRSCRLINAIPRSEKLQVKPTMGHINICESRGEEVSLVRQANTGPVLNERAMGEELPHVQPVVTAPILNQRTIEAEIPQVLSVGTVSVVDERSLVNKFEFLVKVFGEVVSKADKQVCKALNEGSSTDFNYKSLYIDSQKKIEGLMEENSHLSRKLEFALGKIEAYEKMMMGAMCASKEVLLPSPSPLKQHFSQSLAAPMAVNGHKTPSPKPKKSMHISGHKTPSPKPKKHTHKKKNAVF